MREFLKNVLKKLAYYSHYDIEMLSKRIEEFYGINDEDTEL